MRNTANQNNTNTKEQIKKYGKEYISDLTGIYIGEDLAL